MDKIDWVLVTLIVGLLAIWLPGVVMGAVECWSSGGQPAQGFFTVVCVR